MKELSRGKTGIVGDSMISLAHEPAKVTSISISPTSSIDHAG